MQKLKTVKKYVRDEKPKIIRQYVDEPRTQVIVVAASYNVFKRYCDFRNINPSLVTYATSPEKLCSLSPGFKLIMTNGAGYRDDITDALRGMKYETIHDYMD